MDELAQNSTSPQTEGELHSPPSPKRPRTDFPVPDDHSGRSRFDFPELLTFGNTIGIQSLTNVSQNNAGQECTSGCADTEHGKVETEQQDSRFLIPTITSSHNCEADKGSSSPCFITPERSVLQGKNEQDAVHDKLSSSPSHDAGGAFTVSHSLKDASADMPSHPDCGCLGKSLKDELPCGAILPAGDDKDRRQVLNGVSQSRAFSVSSSVEQVRYLSDCTYEEMLCDPGFCHTWSKPAGDGESIQRSVEDGFSGSVLKREAASPISSIDYADSKSSYSIPEEDPSGSMTEGVRSEEEILELQIYGNGNVAFCDAETKAVVNENSMSKNYFPSAAQCTEGSATSYDTALVRNTPSETVSPEDDGCCGAKEASAAGETIAKTESETPDHTTETPMPARISQEAAEGDNDASPFGVIDPAIWSESDGEAEQKHSNSESNEGVELNSFGEIRGVEMALCPDVQASKEESASGKHGTDEEEGIEPQECPNTAKEMHGNAESDEGYSEGKPSPSSSQFPPAEDRTLDSVGDQEQASCLPDSLDHLLIEEVEFLWAEIAELCGTNKVEDTKGLEIKGEKGGDLVDFKEKPLQPNQEHKEETLEMCIHDFITDWEEGRKGNLSYEKTHGTSPGCLYDHQYSAVIQMIDRERKENAGVGVDENGIKDSSEVSVQQEGSQQEKDTTEESSDECISEQTKEKMSKSEDKLILNGQHELTNELSCLSEYQLKPKTDDLLSSPSPPSSDAVVPAPQELRHPQNADKNPTAIVCSDRLSPVPSAFTLCDRAHGAFDTFEKIQFSLDDDGDGDFGLSSSPMLISLSEQLQKPHILISLPPLPEAESKEGPQEDGREGKEEDVERFECRSDNMANGLSSCGYSGDELLNFSPAADIPAHGWSDQKPNCESPLKSSEDFKDELKQQTMPNAVSAKCDKPASDKENKPDEFCCTDQKPNSQCAIKSTEGFKEELRQQAMLNMVSSKCNTPASGEDDKPDDLHLTEQNSYYDTAFKTSKGFHDELMPQSVHITVPSACKSPASGEDNKRDNFYLTEQDPKSESACQSPRGLNDRLMPQSMSSIVSYDSGRPAFDDQDKHDYFSLMEQKPNSESDFQSSDSFHVELIPQSMSNTVSSESDKPASDEEDKSEDFHLMEQKPNPEYAFASTEGCKKELKLQAMPYMVSSKCNTPASSEDGRPDDLHLTEQNPNSESEFQPSDSFHVELMPQSMSNTVSSESGKPACDEENKPDEFCSKDQKPNSQYAFKSTEGFKEELKQQAMPYNYYLTGQNSNSVSTYVSPEDLKKEPQAAITTVYSECNSPASEEDDNNNFHLTKQNPNSESTSIALEDLRKESQPQAMIKTVSSECNSPALGEDDNDNFHSMEQNFNSDFQSSDNSHDELIPQSIPINVSSQSDRPASAEEDIPDDFSSTVQRPNPEYCVQSSEGLEEESKPLAMPKTVSYTSDSSVSGEDDNPDDLDSTEENHSSVSASKSFESFHNDLESIPSTVSAKCEGPASDFDNIPKFEMKKQFDKVLRELNLFFEVSRSEFESYSVGSSPEQRADVTEAWESNTANCRDPLMGAEKDTMSDDTDEVRCLDVRESGPLLSRTPGKDDGEQEVPNSGCTEGSMSMVDPAEDNREPREMDPKRKLWSPSFMCQTLLEQLSHKPPEPIRRLEPLRTCARPLRVGLSKRAKTKHLHRPHPYKHSPEM